MGGQLQPPAQQAAPYGGGEPTNRLRTPGMSAPAQMGQSTQVQGAGNQGATSVFNPQSAQALYNQYTSAAPGDGQAALIRQMQGNDNGAAFNSAMRSGGNVLSGGPGGQYSYQGGHQGAPGAMNPYQQRMMDLYSGINGMRQRLGGGASGAPSVSMGGPNGLLGSEKGPSMGNPMAGNPNTGVVGPRMGGDFRNIVGSLATNQSLLDNGFMAGQQNMNPAQQLAAQYGGMSHAAYSPFNSPYGQLTQQGNVLSQQLGNAK